MAYYYAGRSGDSFTDAMIHDDADCDALDGAARPIAESSVDEDAADWCGECTPFDDAPPSDGDAGETSEDADKSDTCEAELSTGGVCGRELPCRFHSDDYEPKG